MKPVRSSAAPRWIVVVKLSVLIASTSVAPGCKLLSAHEQTQAPCECSLLDKKYRSLFFEFERSTETDGKEGETETYVWLRLRNNTSCTVQLRSLSLPVHIVDGKWVFSEVFEGEEITFLYYEVQIGAERKPHQWSDALAVITLRPGVSMLAAFPAKYFEDDCIISVPFRFDWEPPGFPRDLQHVVCYGADELPLGWDKAPETQSSDPGGD